jgi:hypothetical protein
MKALFFVFPIYEDGDVIVAAGNMQRKEVVDMDHEVYTNIGYAVVWCVKYILIPFGVAVSSRIVYDRLLPPQPERQRKKRSDKNRFK